jgi:hypothetical protein
MDVPLRNPDEVWRGYVRYTWEHDPEAAKRAHLPKVDLGRPFIGAVGSLVLQANQNNNHAKSN